MSDSLRSRDLKLQLGELQRRFAPGQVRGPQKPRPDTELEIHLPPMPSMKPLQPQTTQDKPRQQQGQLAAPAANATTKTVDFLGDLSDGLLAESRRLAHENSLYKSKLAKVEQENSQLNQKLSNLTTVFERANAKEEELNDANWELQLKIKNLEQVNQRAQLDLKNFKSSHDDSRISSDQLKSSLDQLKQERDAIVNDLKTQLAEKSAQVDELKDSNDNLNDENDLLHQNIISLKEQNDHLQSDLNEIKAQLADDDDDGADSSHLFDDSIITEIPVDTQNEESLKKNLQHAYTIIKKLRYKQSKLKSSRRSPNKSSFLLPQSAGNDLSWQDNEEDSFARGIPTLEAPLLDSSDDDDDNHHHLDMDMAAIAQSSPVKESVAQSTGFIMVVPEHITANEVLSNLESYKSYPITKSDFVVLNQTLQVVPTDSPNKKVVNNIESSKVKLVTLEQFNDLQRELQLKDEQLSKLKQSVPPSSPLKMVSNDRDNKKQIEVLNDKLNTINQNYDNLQHEYNQLLTEHTNVSQKHGKLISDMSSVSFLGSQGASLGMVMLTQLDHHNLKNELTSAKKSLDQLQNQLIGTRDDLVKSQSQVDQFKTQVTSMDIQISKLHSKLSSQEESHQEQLKELEHEIQLKDSQVANLKKELGEMGSRLLIMEEQVLELDHQKKLVISKEDELSKISTMINDHKTQLDEHKALLITKDDELAKCTAIIDEHEQSLNEKDDALSKHVALIDDHKKSLREKDDELSKHAILIDEHKSQLAAKDDQLAKLIDEHEKSLNAKDNELAKHATLLDEHKKSLIEKDNELTKHVAIINDQKSSTDADKQLISAKDAEIGSYLNKIEELEASLNTTSSQLEKYKHSLLDKELEMKKLQTDLSSPDFITSHAKSVGLVALASADHDTLVCQLESLSKSQSALTECQSELKLVQSELSSLQSKMTQPAFISEHAKSFNLITLPIEQHDTNEKQVKSLNDHITNLKTQISSIQAKFDAPGADYIHAKSSLHGLVALPVDEHSMLRENSSKLDSLKSIYEQTELELQSLKNQIEKPALDYIKSKSLDHGHVVLPEEEHQSIQDQLVQSGKYIDELSGKIEMPDLDYIKAKSVLHGIIPVTAEEHDSLKLSLTQLKSQLEDLTQRKTSVDEELEDKREKIVEMELELAKLKSIETDLKDLQQQKLEIDNRVTELTLENTKLNEISKELEAKKLQFEQLQTELESPSLDYIYDKAKLHQIVPLTVDELESMKSQIGTLQGEIEELNKLKSELEAQHTDNDLKLSSVQSDLDAKIIQLDELKAQLESPSKEYIESKSDVHDLVAVPIVEHESMKSQLKSHQLEVSRLQAKLENPSLDYIKSHSSSHNHIILPVTDHEAIVTQLDSFQSQFHSPTPDYIKSKAESHGLVVLPAVEHESLRGKIDLLEKSLDEPDVEYIHSKAPLFGLLPVPVSDHKKLQTELKSKSAQLESISGELKSKKDQLDSLTKEKSEIEDKLNRYAKFEAQFEDSQKELGTKLAELQQIKAQLESPSLAYIKEKADIHQLIAIPMEQHDSLNTQIKQNNLDLEKKEAEIIALRKVKQDLELQGIKSVSMELHDSVQSELAESKQLSLEISKKLDIVNEELKLRDDQIFQLKSNADELQTKADKLVEVESKLHALESEKLELNEKHLQFLKLQEDHAALIKKTDVLSTLELELKETKSQLQSKTEELLKLQNALDAPDKDYIKSKSTQLGLVSIPDKEHQALKNDLELRLEEIEQLGLVKKDLESHQLELSRLKTSKSELESKIDGLLTVESQLSEVTSQLEANRIDFKNVNDLLENPSEDYIRAKSELHGLVAIPMTAHNNSINELNAIKGVTEEKEKELVSLKSLMSSLEDEKVNLTSQIGELQNQTSKLDADLQAKCDELENFKSQIERPSPEYIIAKSDLHGLVAVPKNEWCSTESNLESVKLLAEDRARTIEELQHKLTELESAKSERDALAAEISEMKSKYFKEIETIKGLYENPSSDYLKVKASKIGLSLLAIAELQGLNSKLSAMTSDLNQKNQEIEALQSKVSTLETPSKDYITTRSNAMGFIPIPIFEHKSLTSDLDSKKKIISNLESNNKQLNGELSHLKISHETLLAEVASLKNQIQKPSADYIKTKSLDLNMAAIPIVEQEALFKQLADTKSNLDISSKQLESHKVHIETISEELKEKIAALDEKDRMLFTKEEQIESNIQELNDLRSVIAGKEKQFEVKSAELNSKIGELEASKVEIESKATRLATVTAQLEAYQSEIDAMSTKLVEVNTQLDEHKTQLDGKHKLIEEMEVTQRKSSSMVTELETELETVKAELVIKIKEVENFVDQEDISTKKLAQLELELSDLKKKLNDDLTSFEEKNESLKLQLDEKAAVINNLEALLHEPSIEFIKSKTALHGLIPLPYEEHKRLTSEIEQHKSQLIAFHGIKNQLDDKHTELESHIAQLDEMNIQLEDQHKEIESLQMLKTESLSKVGNLEKENALLNSKLAAQLDETSEKINNLESELQIKNETIEELKKEASEPSIQYVKSKSAIHGFIPIPIVEHTNMISQIHTLKSELEGVRKSFDESAKEKDQIIYQLKSQIESADESTGDEFDDYKLEQKALERGFVLLPVPSSNGVGMVKSESIGTITETNSNIPQQSLALIIDSMDKNGFTCIPTPDYKELVLRDSAVYADNTIDDDDLANVTLEADQIKTQLESKKHQLNKLELQSRRSSFISVSSGSSTIEVHDVLQSKQMLIQKKKENILQNILELEKKRENLQKQINRVSVASYDSQLSTNLNTKLDKKLEVINDKIELANIELNSQESALQAVQKYIETARGMKLAPIESRSSFIANDGNESVHTIDQMKLLKDEIKELEMNYNSKVHELEDLRQSVSKNICTEEMIKHLTSLGYLVTSDKRSSFTSAIDLNPVESRQSMSTTNASEYFDAESVLTLPAAAMESELKSKAAELGLVLIPAAEVSETRTPVAKLQDEEFQELQYRTHELGYELIKIEDLNRLRESVDDLPESLNIVDLQMYANKLQLKLLSDDDIKQLKKRPVTSKELAIKAAELNLIMLNEEEAKELESKKPITAENLIQKGKELGYLCINKSQYIATTTARECDVTTCVILSNTYYSKLLKSHEFMKKNPIQQTPTIPEEASFDPPRPMSVSNIDATSLHTVNTIISNKQEVVAAVAQTIIGEYLYKYYRKLGPFSSIADSRHERYFWIHPYSLTIYWSMSNPVLSDPGKTQIKAMSIVSVESVEDNNPLPPGIYHKSIIVKSHDKSIKLTCPTRQRHNIWFNSFKYLIEKSTENWVNDDHLEDQYAESFEMDKRIELDRSMSFRHSQPRGVSFKSMENRRISSVPSMRSSLRK